MKKSVLIAGLLLCILPFAVGCSKKNVDAPALKEATIETKKSEASKPEAQTDAKPKTEIVTAESEATPVKEERVADQTFTVDGKKLVLKNTSVLDDKIEILIPESFAIMSDEMARVKYPNSERPKYVYTNERGSVNVAFKSTNTPLADTQLEEVKIQMKQYFDKLFPTAVWYKESVETINGKMMVVIEVKTPAIDTKVYNKMLIFGSNGKMSMCTINFIEKDIPQWKPIADAIAQSIKIK